MRLVELADLLDLDIQVTRRANSGEQYVAVFAGLVEYKIHKHASALGRCAGRGDSFQAALEELLFVIQGKWLVIDAADKTKRREFGVPPLLSL